MARDLRHRSGMGDSRQSPIPQDRVSENIDQAQRARDNKRESAERERSLKDRGVDERPGTNEQQPPRRAEGGD